MQPESRPPPPQQVELLSAVSAQDAKALWVFGYGSLCWKPGFQFDRAVIGHVRGYSRKFWQGNATHRGTAVQPGRVATLIDDDKSIVHGVAFAVSGEHAIPYLTKRECTLGGYETRIGTFYPRHGEHPIKVLVYIATPCNELWLGDAPHDEIAEQILAAQGDAGHNVEYLVRLAEFMRRHFPDEGDVHLFSIEASIQRRAEAVGVDVQTLMGDGVGCIVYVKRNGFMRTQPQQRERSPPARDEDRDTFQYAARMPEKSLRCLNI